MQFRWNPKHCKVCQSTNADDPIKRFVIHFLWMAYFVAVVVMLPKCAPASWQCFKNFLNSIPLFK
jgi:hypothetical protein